MKKIAVVADVKKAFQQISVAKKDRDFQRFLWWKDSSCKEIMSYRHCRVVFGISSSPFLLGATLNYMLENATPHLKSTAEILKTSLYVDNVATSLSSLEDAKTFKSDADDIMSSGKFELRGWEIGPTEEHKQVGLLGMKWDTKSDTITLELENVMMKIEGPPTKRKILSLVHMLFDPVGVTAPFTIVPKLLLQETWTLKIGWDAELPPEVIKKFEAWRKQLPQLQELEFPRWMKLDQVDSSALELHVFVDASKDAYAACVYVKAGSEVSLVQCKSRVAPLKNLTIPRLELLSCLIGARLSSSVKADLGMPDMKTTYWTDSSTALYWIQHSGNWAVFVQRRVDEILKLTKLQYWRHIPGEMNPADFPSRGGSIKQIIEKQFWRGPEWIGSRENWPESQVNLDEDIINQEKKKTVVSVVSVMKSKNWEHLRDQPYQDMLRSIVNESGDDINTKTLTEAEKKLIRYVQSDCFNGLEDDKLKRLPVMKDSEGIIRLKTRYGLADFDEEFVYPIVLPNNHWLLNALVMEEHIKNSHAGVQTMMTMLRERFWILRSRRTIRNIIRKCEDCQRFVVKNATAETAPLPRDRICAEVPFQVIGVDLFGPLYLEDGSKCWVSIFTCAVYRAIHLEIVNSLETHTFKNALRRFVARRGRPTIVYSDNGTNFCGLQNAFKKIDWKDIMECGAFDKIEWRVNPPSAPWWGGFWERMVGVVKQSLRRVLGKARLSYEELETVLCDVECTVNQRPLTYVSEDPNDMTVLTPFMFLTGNRKAELPEADAVDRDVRKKWQYIQRVRDDLRSRFRKEYLGHLSQLRDVKKALPLRMGEKVLIGRDNAKRLDWPTGSVIKLIPGKDGKVRTVVVKTEDGDLLTRPIQRIFPLEYRETPEKKNEEPQGTTRSGRVVKIPQRLTFLIL